MLTFVSLFPLLCFCVILEPWVLDVGHCFTVYFVTFKLYEAYFLYICGRNSNSCLRELSIRQTRHGEDLYNTLPTKVEEIHECSSLPSLMLFIKTNRIVRKNSGEGE